MRCHQYPVKYPGVADARKCEDNANEGEKRRLDDKVMFELIEESPFLPSLQVVHNFKADYVELQCDNSKEAQNVLEWIHDQDLKHVMWRFLRFSWLGVLWIKGPYNDDININEDGAGRSQI